MRFSNHRNNRAFSLIEMVIVVVIIGIIAAIAIPRLSRGADGAAEAAILGDLAVVRHSIDLYVTEHRGTGPRWPKTFESQMTEYTDLNGNTSAVQVSPFIYGPYLRAVPKNPYYNHNNTVTLAIQADAAARTLVGPAGIGGWAYYDGGSGGDPIFYANTTVRGENSF